jgi:hypothetical protein
MTRLPGMPAGQARKPNPDVYTVLLLVGILFLSTACIVVLVDLTRNYGMTIGQLFSSAPLPR